MVSKTLLKLIDEAIVPALLIVGTKLGSVFILSGILNITWDFKTLSITSAVSEADFIALNSYSNLIMFLCITIGLLWVVVKSHILHDTHITPTLAAKLVSLKLESFISTTAHIYHQALIWWLYTVLITFLISLQTYYGLVYSWVTYVSVVAAISSTWLIVLDIERESVLAKGEEKFEVTSLDIE